MSVIAGLVVLIGAASAEASTQAAPVDKMVCKRIDQHETGSHMSGPRKVCKKASEWRALDAETQRAMRDVRSRSEMDPDAIPRGR